MTEEISLNSNTTITSWKQFGDGVKIQSKKIQNDSSQTVTQKAIPKSKEIQNDFSQAVSQQKIPKSKSSYDASLYNFRPAGCPDIQSNRKQIKPLSLKRNFYWDLKI